MKIAELKCSKCKATLEVNSELIRESRKKET